MSRQKAATARGGAAFIERLSRDLIDAYPSHAHARFEVRSRRRFGVLCVFSQHRDREQEKQSLRLPPSATPCG
jgi:hypothetical protein